MLSSFNEDQRVNGRPNGSAPGVHPGEDAIPEPKKRGGVSSSLQKLPDGFRYDKRGSIEFLLPRKTEDEDEVWAWLCSPLEVLAETRSEEEKGWGLLVRVQTPDGLWHTQAMPRRYSWQKAVTCSRCCSIWG